jgi:hypothetical protein
MMMKKEQFWKALKSGEFASMVGESSRGHVVRGLFADFT